MLKSDAIYDLSFVDSPANNLNIIIINMISFISIIIMFLDQGISFSINRKKWLLNIIKGKLAANG